MKAAQKLDNWIPLRSLSISDLPKCGDCPAVYGLRDSRSLHVLKYGETGALRRRIFANYLGGFGGNSREATTQRIHRQLFADGMIDYVDLAWIATSDKAEAKLLEDQFRTNYKQANQGRRPLWDRQG